MAVDRAAIHEFPGCVTVPLPVIRMTCARNGLVPLHSGLMSTSSIVALAVSAPPMPLYMPVPEPATIGVAAVTVMLPEHVCWFDGQFA